MVFVRKIKDYYVLAHNVRENSKIIQKSKYLGKTLPPKWNELDKELDNLFKWYTSINRKLHVIELAALIHLKLIPLQPFADGNSRLSRLIMNWVLWKRKYPLIDIRIEDLEHYYDVLDKYQIEHDEKPFVKYIKKKFIET